MGKLGASVKFFRLAPREKRAFSTFVKGIAREDDYAFLFWMNTPPRIFLTLFGLATGFSDKIQKIRMTLADLMLQGSVGKTYVAASAFQLVHEDEAIDLSLLRQMLDGVPAKLGPNTKYGLGFIIRQTPFGASYGHSGFFPGYLTEMMYFPDSKIAIAVQVNTSVPRATGKPLMRFIYEFVMIVLKNKVVEVPNGSRERHRNDVKKVNLVIRWRIHQN